MAKIKVTLTKSPIGEQPRLRKVVAALGLRKMHQTVEFEVSQDEMEKRIGPVFGAVKKVSHLVTVTEG